MKLRPLFAAALCFCLGAAAFWAASTHTRWLNFLERHTEYRAVDSNAMEWIEQGKDGPATYAIKYLYKNVNARQVVLLVRYPAGKGQPLHVHSHGHGMYVISGTLLTNRGSYGPGTFVWFPANEVASHGASPDGDVVVLFLRHEDFDIKYLPANAH